MTKGGPMHALHLPPRHLWKIGVLALALTTAVLVVAALVAPTLADLAAPSATTVHTAASRSAPSAHCGPPRGEPLRPLRADVGHRSDGAAEPPAGTLSTAAGLECPAAC